MGEKIKTFWEKKSTDILIGIIILLFIGGLRLYDSKEDLRAQNELSGQKALMDVLFELKKVQKEQGDLINRQGEVLVEINNLTKTYWGYNVIEKKVDSSWIKLWQNANRKRNPRGGSSSVIENNDDLINNIQYVPDESNIANTRAR